MRNCRKTRKEADRQVGGDARRHAAEGAECDAQQESSGDWHELSAFSVVRARRPHHPAPTAATATVADATDGNEAQPEPG